MDWDLMAVRLAKRQRAVEDLRQHVLYQKIVSAGLSDHILPGPDYNNPSISKRQWEQLMRQWRKHIFSFFSV